MTASSESAEKGYGPFSSGAVSEKGLSPVSEAPLDDKYLIEHPPQQMAGPDANAIRRVR